MHWRRCSPSNWASCCTRPQLARNMGIAFNLPIFDGGLRDARHGASTAALAEAIATYNGAVVDAARDVSSAARRLESSQAQHGLRERQHQAADGAVAQCPCPRGTRADAPRTGIRCAADPARHPGQPAAERLRHRDRRYPAQPGAGWRLHRRGNDSMSTTAESIPAAPARSGNGKRRRILLTIASVILVLALIWVAAGDLRALEAREDRRRLRHRQPGADLRAAVRNGGRGVRAQHLARGGRPGAADAGPHGCAAGRSSARRPRWRRPCARCASSRRSPSQFDSTHRGARTGTAARRSRIWRSANPCWPSRPSPARKCAMPATPSAWRVQQLAQAREQSRACARAGGRSAGGGKPGRTGRTRAPTRTRGCRCSAPPSWRRSRGFVAQRSVQLGQRIAPGRTADEHHAAAGCVDRSELQGRPAAPSAHRAGRQASSPTCTAAVSSSTAMSSGCPPAPARRSRCCRRRMHRATGSRWCSACR